MRRLVVLLLLVALGCTPLLLAMDKTPAKDAGPVRIPTLSLPDADAKLTKVGADDKAKATVVVFLGTGCPLVNQYALRLKELHNEYVAKGVAFVAINSNSQDSAEQIKEHAKAHQLPFPVLLDPKQKTADVFGAKRTPEVFVLDPQCNVVYRGRIDDQFGIGYQKGAAARHDLIEALKEILAGKPVSIAVTEATGCLITRTETHKTTANVTFTKDIAPILQNHCQECHRPGQIGPFSLLSYKQAKGWSAMIAEVVKERRMPPWHADPAHGKFKNDRSLPPAERDTLLAWIDSGCAEGDPQYLPPPKNFESKDGWTIGKPDVIFTMKEEYQVPAKAPRGGVPYQHFLVQTNFEEDKWVVAAEALPGNRSVVHHILIYVMAPGENLARRHEDAIGRNFLVATAPGDMPTILPAGMAKKIPKGATLIFQMHYTPNGVEQKDRSHVGLVFAKEPPKHNVRTRTILNRRFALPPGDENHEVVSTSTFNKDVVLLSFMPHMHLRGKSFTYKAHYPDGKVETLLNVPKFDFGWQTMYRVAQPLRLPAGTKVECIAHFDNSDRNLNNPDAKKTVYWGDQTWEEMMIGWVDYYYVDEQVAAAK